MIDICSRLKEAYVNPKIHTTRGKSGVNPSGVSIEIDGKIEGACHRQGYFSWFGYKKEAEINPDWTLAAVMGEWIHVGVVEEIRNHPLETGLTVLSAEQSFFNQKHMISGRTDIFMLDNLSKKIFGVDIKSVGEYVCKRTIEKPKMDHILQCAVYLWEYQQTSNQGYQEIDEWVILYVSRDENWDLKKFAHGSSLRQMWQFSIKFENGHVVVENQHGITVGYPEITMDKILERYETFLEKIKAKELPDRDFDAQYSEDQIVSLYKSKKLEYKKDIAAVEKWLKKGAVEGELNMKMGDSACMFCPYVKQCYSADPLDYEKAERVLFSMPEPGAVAPLSPPKQIF
jgi:hypothetical protein